MKEDSSRRPNATGEKKRKNEEAARFVRRVAKKSRGNRVLFSLSLSFPPFSRGTTRVSRSFLPTCAISPFEQIRIPGSKPKVFSPSTLTDIYMYIISKFHREFDRTRFPGIVF